VILRESYFVASTATSVWASPGRQWVEGFMVIGSMGVCVRQDAAAKMRPASGSKRMVFMGVVNG
jgi:hypothetical protein